MKKLKGLYLTLMIGILGLMGCSEKPADTNHLNSAVSETSGIVGAETFSNDDLGLRATVALIDLQEQRLFCTGTLISPQTILTAAHCVQTGPATAKGVQFFDGSIIEYDMALRHMGYGLSKNEDDIAILHLTSPAPAGTQIAQIPRSALKPGSYKTRAFGIGRTASGVYDSGEMRMVNLKGTVTSVRPLFLQYRQSNGKGVCKGDSGGPHFTYTNGKPVLVAITTQAENTLTLFGGEVEDFCRRTSIATLTGTYFSWISQAVSALTQ